VITSSWPSRRNDADRPFTASRDTVKPRRSRSKRDRFWVAFAVIVADPVRLRDDGS
jgi:hypothetical protein